MFRQFAGSIPKVNSERAENLFRLHPVELSSLLEQAWELRKHDDIGDQKVDQGHPNRRSNLPGLPHYLLRFFACSEANIDNVCPLPKVVGATPDSANAPPIDPCREPRNLPSCVTWNHLIYAYMIENTGIYEIFRRVLHEFRHGEALGVPLDGADHWLRNTEELFYRQPPSFSIASLNSFIRPDLNSIRCNAYYRMFGMELNHHKEDQINYVKAKAANNEFVNTLEEFLRKVWVGIINVGNSSGENRTDDAEIANLAEKLHDMLIARRIGGNLAREEFYFVSMMSWFQLTIEFDSPIVMSLRAEGPSPEERLHKIAQRVGKPAHALSKNFFDMADASSRILSQIETNIYKNPAAVPALYTNIPGGPIQDIKTIITHWSITTGHDLKSKKVSAN